VNAVVALVPVPFGGENGKGDATDADDDEGGVVDVLGGTGTCGRLICDGGRGMGTRAEPACVPLTWGGDSARYGDVDTDDPLDCAGGGLRWVGWEYGSDDDDGRPIKLSTGSPSRRR